MIVVSDTSPLHYLVLIQHESLLPALFGRVIATPAVMAELGRAQAPEIVRKWLAHTPEWLEIQAPRQIAKAALRLGPGEAEAISLAREIGADLVLIDERQGAKLARAEGLVVTGTLGVLRAAGKRGLVSLPDALAALANTTYHHTKALFDEVLRETPPDDES